MERIGLARAASGGTQRRPLAVSLARARLRHLDIDQLPTRCDGVIRSTGRRAKARPDLVLNQGCRGAAAYIDHIHLQETAMTRQTRPKAVAVAPTPIATRPWDAWPWATPALPPASERHVLPAPEGSGQGLAPAAILESLASVQAQFMAAWFGQLVAAQQGWFELAKALPAAMLVPLGWRMKTPAVAPDAAAAPYRAIAAMLNLGSSSDEGSLLQWVEAWKPAHSEDVVA
jgi:hypothetical protein